MSDDEENDKLSELCGSDPFRTADIKEVWNVAWFIAT